MSLIRIQRDPTRGQLLVFGGAWLVCLGTLGFVASGRTAPVLPPSVLWTLAILVPVVGLLVPGFMRMVYLGMMWATFPIGWVVSQLVLAIVYYLVITPTGLLMRRLGHDPINRRFDPQADTYWTRQTPPDDPDRYFRQF